MSNAIRFAGLLRAQLVFRGEAVTALFTTPATDISVPCVVGGAGYSRDIWSGGTADTGTVEFQCLKAALSDEGYTPAKRDGVTMSTDSVARTIDNVSESHGIYTITLSDAAAS